MTTETVGDREAFETKAFAQRYIKSIRRVADSGPCALMPVDCPTKAEFVKRDAGGDYLDPTLGAMWWAWQASREVQPVAPVTQQMLDAFVHAKNCERGGDLFVCSDEAARRIIQATLDAAAKEKS